MNNKVVAKSKCDLSGKIKQNKMIDKDLFETIYTSLDSALDTLCTGLKPLIEQAAAVSPVSLGEVVRGLEILRHLVGVLETRGVVPRREDKRLNSCREIVHKIKSKSEGSSTVDPS